MRPRDPRSRARESTRLYASAERLDAAGDQDAGGGREDRLARLAERLGREEVEVPSIAVPLAHEQRVERELDRESGLASPRRPSQDEGSRRLASDQRERLDEQRAQAQAALAQARTELERAARVISTLPEDHQAQQALTDAVAAGHQAQHAAAQAGQLSDQLAGLGRFARFGERGRTLRAQLGMVRDRERQALERQQRFEQEAQTRHARLVEQRQVWEAEHPGARERHQAATDAYQHAQERHHAAEQTHDALLAHDLVAASFPEPGARRWPQRPDDPPKPEPHRPARGIERGPYRGREGPSLGL